MNGKKGSGDTFDYTCSTTQELALKWEKEKFHYTVNAVQIQQAHTIQRESQISVGPFLSCVIATRTFYK